jgi:ubiquinone/menaquinone biosynthesis C-methylase UbiE
MYYTNALSPELIAHRFESPAAAKKYSMKASATVIDSREKQCVRQLLKDYGSGSRVLDIACGTGRMLPLLMEKGFKITAADYSGFMIENAMAGIKTMNDNCDIEFGVENAMCMSFPDESFDIVLCNRLIHHFADPQDRVTLLRELARVSRKTVIISFFWSLSWDALTFFLKYFISGSELQDRVPISISTIRRDIDMADMEIKHILPKKRFISKQCYLLLEKKNHLI